MTAIIPIETDGAPVRVTGEALHPVLWRGRQWAVTTFGVESLDGIYSFPASRLSEEFAAWSWLRQMGEKHWVDLPDFTTAFMVAIVLHGGAPGFDREQIMGDFRIGMKQYDRTLKLAGGV